MNKSIYVGNLPWSATEEQIRNLFEGYGTVNSVNLVSDRETGRARGFGFVEMAAADAEAAIQALDGSSMDGRSLKVNDPIRGREWAIAVTEAEKLYAWLVYVAEMMPKDDRQ